MHRERAAKHQEELRLKASETINAQDTVPSTQNMDPVSSSSNMHVTTSVLPRDRHDNHNVTSSRRHFDIPRNDHRHQPKEDNVISTWSTAFNTVEENVSWGIPKIILRNGVNADSWKQSKLMTKFKNRAFSPAIQSILDTTYKYYNPFSSEDDHRTYGGLDPRTGPNPVSLMNTRIGTMNNTYKELTKYWKNSFIASIESDQTSFRLLWTTSMSWHFAGLKIFSLLKDSTDDIMHVIGACLVGRSIYVSKKDIKDKAQYDSDYIDRDNSVITNLHPLAYKVKTSSYPEYRFFCAFIQQYYEKRTKDCVKNGFLMTAGDLAQFCYAEKNDNISRCYYGSEMQFFGYRKQAMLRTFEYIDDFVDKYPLDSDSEDDGYSDSPYFSDEEKVKVLGMHRDRLKDMLFMLQFTGFESTLKCPCSKLYSDVIFLYGCPLPENQCKNQVFRDIGSLYQHFDNKGCIFHTVLSKYIFHLSTVSGIGTITTKKRKKRSRK